MKKIKQLLLEIPMILLGIIFLLSGFAKIADLSAFQNELLKMEFMPYFMIGLGILFIPGLQLTLGLIFIFQFNTLKKLNPLVGPLVGLKKSAAIIAFIFLLSALTFGVYLALTTTKGCGGCGQLEETVFDWKVWQPVGIYLITMLLSVITLFIVNSNDSRKSISESN